MRKNRKLSILLIACLLVTFCATAALAAGQVFQGIAISFDPQGKVLVLKNSEPDKNKVDKNLAQVTFDLSKAKVGMAPAPGDKIRVAYEVVGEKYIALKVMNVTKQDLRKK